MKVHSIITVLVLAGIGFGCYNDIHDSLKTIVTDKDDYNVYLAPAENSLVKKALAEFEFWSKKWDQNNSQFPYLAKMAAANSQMFNANGNIEYLIEAEKNLKMVNQATGYNNPSYLRSLASNYITQHKFKESLELLIKAEANGENLRATKKMLFDVHLELGNVDEAGRYLMEIGQKNDFDFLIRISKWKDHQGNLKMAINYMEKAVYKAEATNNKNQKLWAYTNLSDFYGHDGQIEKAYNNYLKSLEIESNEAYAKKGIAWIVYSHDRNPKEALRILNSIMKQYRTPDYYLLKAEIAAYENDSNAKTDNVNLYLAEVEKGDYGDMYNKYSALHYAEEATNLDLAFELARREISLRPTPLSYDLLAWTHYNQGDIAMAAKIMEDHVVNKTTEPIVLLHLAHIYKAQGNEVKTKELKMALLESVFELGPLLEKKVKLL